MAGVLKMLGRTRFGQWLWTQSHRRSWLGGGVGVLTAAVRSAEWAALRRLPAHRRHDAAVRARLAAFEAETRSAAPDFGTAPGLARRPALW